MIKSELQNDIQVGLSTRGMASKYGKSQTTVRYWLRKHGLVACGKSGPKTPQTTTGYLCSFCGVTDPDKFYGYKRTRCGPCHNKDVIAKAREKKTWAVALLGGCCSRCGYKKSNWALQFHHVDPTEKDKTFSSMLGWSKVRITTELKKCILVCSNCHAEIHEEEFSWRGKSG